MKTEATFTELVELHERTWGTKRYRGRPSLDQLLNSFIVVMWGMDQTFKLSVHQDAAEVNNIIHGLLTGGIANPNNRKLLRIFVNQEPIKFKIKIIAERREGRPLQQVLSDLVPLNRQADVVPLKNQPELVPLPKHPGSKYGEALPGRKAPILPGRKAEILKTRFKPKTKTKK